jgi:hypothetical protein
MTMAETTPKGYSVIYRNPGHWDVCSNGARDFRIRGEPGSVLVSDERPGHLSKAWMVFRSVQVAMSYIADQYMIEPVKEASPDHG